MISLQIADADFRALESIAFPPYPHVRKSRFFHSAIRNPQSAIYLRAISLFLMSLSRVWSTSYSRRGDSITIDFTSHEPSMRDAMYPSWCVSLYLESDVMGTRKYGTLFGGMTVLYRSWQIDFSANSICSWARRFCGSVRRTLWKTAIASGYFLPSISSKP